MTQTFRPVAIITTQDTRVALLEHRGDPARIGDSVQRFIAWRKQAGLPPHRSATFNILHANPHDTPAEAFRLGLCATLEHNVPPNQEGIVESLIPGGRCAVLRHVGPETTLGDALGYLCAVWWPQSGERRRDFPLYCQRVAFFPEVPEHAAITDIYLPFS